MALTYLVPTNPFSSSLKQGTYATTRYGRGLLRNEFGMDVPERL
jgi:hypothetical protein